MDRLPTDGLFAPRVVLVCVALGVSSLAASSGDLNSSNSAAAFANVFMSPMGRIAQRFVATPVVPSGRMDNPPMRKSQFTVAVDYSGQHVVVGFNDPRGFARSPISTAGFMFSDDGGKSFVDGGDLPTSYPCQLFGHPQVRYAGGSTFVYTTIAAQAQNSAQTLALYRSFDYGHTWNGPFEITAATSAPSLDWPGEAADSEFIDIDPHSGRLLVAWTTFTMTASGPAARVCTTYSDNALTGFPPTWSKPAVLDPETRTFDSAAMPRFGSGRNAYVVWTQSIPGSHLKNIAFATSSNGGSTWNAPKTLRASDFPGVQPNLAGEGGEDSACLAVDDSKDTVYVAYSDNSSGDGGDVMLQRSSDGGKTFSAPISLSPRPGQDRAQWAPWITVDPLSGALHLAYLDQGVSESGDLSVMREATSQNQGRTWTLPAPVCEEFHASLGTAGTPPNIGEYNEIAAQHGQTFCAFPRRDEDTALASLSSALTPPTSDIGFNRMDGAVGPWTLKAVRAINQDGSQNLEPGDTVTLTVVLNALPTNRSMTSSLPSIIEATLATDNPLLNVSQGRSRFEMPAKGQDTASQIPFRFELGPGVRANENLNLSLHLEWDGGETYLPVKLLVGSTKNSTLLEEDFAGSRADLPSGWIDSSLAGSARTRWVHTSEPFVGVERREDNDGALIDCLQSPSIVVPPAAEELSVDFDIAYNTRADAVAKTIAYSGCSLKVVDETAMQAARPIDSLAVQFVSEKRGHQMEGYPAHLGACANAACDQNLGVWAGGSNGIEHVHLVFAAAEGHAIRLRWDYTQQPTAFPTAPESAEMPSGVFLGHVIVRALTRQVVTSGPTATPASFSVNEEGVIYGHLPAAPGASYELVKPAAHAQMWVHDNGDFAYRPRPGYYGSDEFSYRLSGNCSAKLAIVHLMVNPILKRVYIAPRLKPGSHYLGNIALTGLAPLTGLSVALKSSDKGVSLPATVQVKPGASSQEFPLDTSEAVTRTCVTVSFALNGIEKTLDIQLLPSPALAAVEHEYKTTEGESIRAGIAALLSGCRIDRAEPLKTLAASMPQHGTLDLRTDGSFFYTPVPGFNGTDRFSYVVRQNGVVSEPAQVTVRVLPKVLTIDLSETRVIGGITLRCVIGISGQAPRGGELVQIESSAPEIAAAPDRVLIPDMNGQAVIAIKTAEVHSPRTVTITAGTPEAKESSSFVVLPRMPIETATRTYRVSQAERLTISAPGLLENAVDPNPGGAERARKSMLVDRPSHGDLTIGADGAFVYVAAEGFCGRDWFSYVVQDGISQSNPTKVEILVEPSIADMTLSASEVSSGDAVTAELELTGETADEPLRLELEASRNDCLETPNTLVVPKGARSAKFTISARRVTERTPVYIEARLNGERKTVLLVVRP